MKKRERRRRKDPKERRDAHRGSGVGIQNPHRRTVGSQLLTSLIIIFKLKS
jgi:hypothetical protein